jgi:hypothetical protein
VGRRFISLRESRNERDREDAEWIGAAAILAAGVGSFALAVLAIAGDKSPAIRNLLNWYRPTGALSGVTTGAIVVWLLVWVALERRWRDKDIAMGRVAGVGLTLLGLSLLLTFPPMMDLL